MSHIGDIGAMVEQALEEVDAKELGEPKIGDRRPYVSPSKGWRDGWQVYLSCKECGRGYWVREAAVAKKSFTGRCNPCICAGKVALMHEKQRAPTFRKEKTAHFKDGSFVDPQGYRRILITEDNPYFKMGHKLKDRTTVYVGEHRLVMAQKIGRCLGRKEIVHHKDGNKLNNDPSNLKLTNWSEHHWHGIAAMDDLRERIAALESEVVDLREQVMLLRMGCFR